MTGEDKDKEWLWSRIKAKLEFEDDERVKSKKQFISLLDS